MFERFTSEARGVVINARAQARQLHHPYIGTEHLLLALLEPEAGVVSAVLHEAGVATAHVRGDLARLIGPAPDVLSAEDAAVLQTIGIDLPAVLARVEQSLGPDALAPPSCPPPRRASCAAGTACRTGSGPGPGRFWSCPCEKPWHYATTTSVPNTSCSG